MTDEPGRTARRVRDVRRGVGDDGAATSLSVALLTPMFVFLAFAAFQAAMWSHAKTEARVVARDTA
ncbi:MAG: TadE/TadG family type IV pilus assembly protein, partial [Ilumatobacteraceae bacterium]